MELPRPGDTFEGKYQILGTLGAGGFATVFKARDVEIGREVAIKILAPRDGEYPQQVVSRFMVEARVIAQLRDPHTIRLFEFGNSNAGLLFMVFQYVAGEDLKQVVQRMGPLPPETVIHVGKQVLSALAEAHEIGILHRDLKPANVLVHEYMGDPFNAKLLDFGIAKVDDAVGGVSLTKTGALLGTPRYMSPEQVFGEPLGPTSDIYSLGLVLYEMLLGHPALQGDRKDVLSQHAAETRHRVPEHAAWPALRSVIERMLAHEPHARYPSAFAASQALEFARVTRSMEQPQRADPTTQSHRGPATSSAEVYHQGHFSSGTVSQSRSGTGSSHSAFIAARDNRRAVLALGSLAVILSVGFFAVTSKRSPEEVPVPRRVESVPSELLKGGSAPEPPPVELVEVVDMGQPDAVAELTPVDLGPSPGCGLEYEPTIERWVDTGVSERRARVYLPRQYNPDTPYPVILTFGPKYESEGSFAKAARTSKLAFHKGLFIGVVVSPSNRFDPWNDGEVDVRATRGALAAVETAFCVDRQRIYGLGHHDGASFLRDLACRMPFAGIALSGWEHKTDKRYCDLHPVVPTLFVSGNDNGFIPLEGGFGCTDAGPYANIDEREGFWRSMYGCDGEPKRLSKTKSSVCQVWENCDAPLALCRADGGHHLGDSDWQILFPKCRNTTLQFEVAPEAWSFFKAHGRPISPLDARHLR